MAGSFTERQEVQCPDGLETEQQPMTPSAPSPKPRRGMLAFYGAMGAVVVLFAAGYFAWTPLRIWYWEREVLREEDPTISADLIGASSDFRREHAAYYLLAAGDQARPAIRRLLSSDRSGVRMLMVVVCGGSRDLERRWVVPHLVEIARTDHDAVVRTCAVTAVADITNVREDSPSFYRDPGVRELLKWWKREGKAKYGRSG